MDDDDLIWNINDTIETKQEFLRKEIIEQGYDGEEFQDFMTSMHPNQTDIDLSEWDMTELQAVVIKFKTEVSKGNIKKSEPALSKMRKSIWDPLSIEEEEETTTVHQEVPVRPSVNDTELSNYRNREEMRNGLICIQTIEGDDFEKIGQYYGIKVKKLLNYNDKTENHLNPGELVFLKRKKSKAARGYEFHRVKEGETLHQIAQQYGVRLKKLLYYNYLSADTPLVAGEKIFLRKKTEVL
jgi:LysM repeat protein